MTENDKEMTENKMIANVARRLLVLENHEELYRAELKRILDVFEEHVE